jgi:hypothetical protein
MGVLFWGVVLVVVFVLAHWGGRVLSCHYGDGSEVGAALAVSLGMVVPVGLVDYTRASGAVDDQLVAAAHGAGLIAGYGPRAGHR